ncbi:MAG: glycosyltransferase family 2 protein [Erysipelotrichaceae bacterium]
MKISVIVPVYNAQKYIARCVSSLLAQSYRSFEIIFVNDGSSDNSEELLKSYHSDDISITIINQENGGQASARNQGIKQAKGEFLCFVDIDDYVHSDLLLKLITQLEKENADLVWCDAFIVKDNKVIGTLDTNITHHNDCKKDYILHNASPWRKLIRASIIKDHDLLFPNIRFYEDLAVVPAYSSYSNKISYLDEPLYYYDLHEGSTMHQSKNDQRLLCIFDALSHLIQCFQKMKIDKTYQMELEYIYIDHLLHAASLRFFKFNNFEALYDITEIFKSSFINWQKNKYYKKQSFKYKFICRLFYHHHYKILSKILK